MYLNVKAEIKRRNLTLEDVAQELNIRTSTLSLKLNGKAPITLKEAKAIKDYLNSDIPLEELFEVTNCE
ncbi:helix-turn-helix transcriptional regulator [Peptacetobacter sp.]|uniref:helix-turn-helix transcriptional regulator n=1 Tax=Peptacetobacter sp. TaxID=2991975 RepID=UPI003AB3FA62